MSIKKWVVGAPDFDRAAALAEECGISPFLALLLDTRGINTAEEAAEFLSGGECSEDPYAFADMDVAVERIQRALDMGETIAVFGDYDADGITATVLLSSFLREHGGNVRHFIPRREGEGYGLHASSIRRMAEEGVTLLITVDNGIASTEEATLAASLGMDMVITDHHQPQNDLPAAVAVVDPHRTDCESTCKDYAGVGVAFMLACALEGDMDAVMERYGDLLALGTLADVMPLRGEIRRQVREGLRVLERRERIGLKALADVSGLSEKSVTASNAVFTLAPRINAAGRMGNPDRAADLLFCEDPEEAATIAAEIQGMNVERQNVELNILSDVNSRLAAHPEWLAERVLVVDGRGWHNGVLGILASRLCERCGKPCVVLSEQEDGTVKGSGRSVRGFSLFNALTYCKEMLLTYGGHELAAGVSLEAGDIDRFREKINEYARNEYPVMPLPELAIDFRIRPAQIDVEKLEAIAALEPCGTANPSPVFGLFKMKLEAVSPVGNGRHLRLTLSRDGTQITAMKFGMTAEEFPVSCGSILNLAVSLDRSEYRGVVSPSIIVKDVRYSDTDQDELLGALADFEALMRGETPQHPMPLPGRDRMAVMYRFLRGSRVWKGTVEQLKYAVGEGFSFAEVQIAVEMLCEAGLLRSENSGGMLTLELCETTGKVDLYATDIARRLAE